MIAAFMDFAQAMERIVKQEGVEKAFQRCTARKPSAKELERLRQAGFARPRRVCF